MNIHSLIAGSVIASGIAFAASGTLAAPITSGTLGMAGTYQAENGAGTNVALGSANWIDFCNGGVCDPGAPSTSNTGTFLVTQATGGFAGVAGLTGIIHDLLFNPSTPINSFFTTGSLVFNLASTVINSQNNTGITLTGTGTFQPGTADATSGTWSGSFQTDGTNLTGIFTWSANASPSPVPEPATLAILGASLLGLGVIRRRKA